MRAIFSFVIDGDPKFDLQTRLFLASLTAVGVPAEQIHAHCTASASERSRGLLALYGVTVHSLEPFLDGKYCNKLVQLETLIQHEADLYILCDTDLAFVSQLDRWFDLDIIRAKPVDLPNPPLAKLEELKKRLGVGGVARIVNTSCGGAQTWSVNCNGGIYFIPLRFAQALAERWKGFARQLRSCANILEGWYHHIDQIAFALAMLDLGEDVLELPLEANFPMHLGNHFPSMQFEIPKVLHYHWLQNEDAQVLLTGHPIIDVAIAKVNASLLSAPPPMRGE